LSRQATLRLAASRELDLMIARVLALPAMAKPERVG
jgi:hypothetical protein